MKNVLFLDIDGVLATESHWDEDSPIVLSTGKLVPYGWNQECCDILSEIVEQFDLDIVLSSDWRLQFDLSELKEIFKFHKMNPDRLKEVTEKNLPKKMSEWSQVEMAREREILKWVEKNQPNHWVAIDDLSLIGLPKENFVMVRNSETGLNQEIVVDILKNKIKKNEQIISES
jgi:hypothetical protein